MIDLGINKPKAETTIVVAMSGGVDSSTVAALLHESGYKVIGVTLQLYDEAEIVAKSGTCCAGLDIYDAKQVAETYGFPHYVLDYESIFKQEVIEEFADSYLKGETPIPCVRCNQSVKFRDLFKVAKDLGADGLATGHYVKRIEGKSRIEMHRGMDQHKDQSYFLFATTQAQLDYLYFPLGGMDKEETRKEAIRLGLSVADKKDSQDICFVPNGSYSSVIEKLRPEASDPGEIIHVDGTVLGKHKGIIHYTIGQRRGLTISAAEPLYVVKLDPENKHVIVGPKSCLFHDHLSVGEMNWLGDAIPEDGLAIAVKLRSTQEAVKATLYPANVDTIHHVTLHAPERAITPGQACVFYEGEHMVGGGWIQRA